MGGSRISGKVVRLYKGMGVRFADFLVFLRYPMKIKLEIYFTFIGYLKRGQKGDLSEPSNPPLYPPQQYMQQ